MPLKIFQQSWPLPRWGLPWTIHGDHSQNEDNTEMLIKVFFFSRISTVWDFRTEAILCDNLLPSFQNVADQPWTLFHINYLAMFVVWLISYCCCLEVINFSFDLIPQWNQSMENLSKQRHYNGAIWKVKTMTCKEVPWKLILELFYYYSLQCATGIS